MYDIQGVLNATMSQSQVFLSRDKCTFSHHCSDTGRHVEHMDQSCPLISNLTISHGMSCFNLDIQIQN